MGVIENTFTPTKCYKVVDEYFLSENKANKCYAIKVVKTKINLLNRILEEIDNSKYSFQVKKELILAWSEICECILTNDINYFEKLEGIPFVKPEFDYDLQKEILYFSVNKICFCLGMAEEYIITKEEINFAD